RTRWPRQAEVIGVRSQFVRTPEDGSRLHLPTDRALEALVFDLMGAGHPFGPSGAVSSTVGVTAVQAKRQLLDAVAKAGWTEGAAKLEARRLWEAAYPGPTTELTDAEMGRLLAEVRPPEGAKAQGASHPP